MKKSTGYLLTMSFALIALASSVSFCSHAAPTTTYDMTLMEKQASFTVVTPAMSIGDNELNFVVSCQRWQDVSDETLSPVKAKGLITAYSERYCKQFWLIPYKIKPGSKAYEYLAVLGKTHNILSGEPKACLKIPEC